MLLGLCAGAAAAAGAFFYDGGGRVNVLLVLALFVLLPLATVLLFVVAAASRRGLRSLSAGQLGRGLAAILPARGARALAGLAAGEAGAAVAKWLLLSWSQWLGIGFSIGALLAAFALVLFTDIAFGWATTLEVDPARITAIARALAVPWSSIAPGAVPDAALVEGSRYFRLAFAGAWTPDPALLGRWWPFVLMAMLCYGVAPRLLTLGIARWRLAAACRRALLADRRARDLLDRMNTPLVDTRSPVAEHPGATPPPPAHTVDLPPCAGYRIVNWSLVPVDAARIGEVLGRVPLLSIDAAGGSLGTADDRALAQRLGGGDAGVLVLAKAWEPPTLELIDFLEALRAALPAAHPLAVLPVSVRDGGAAPAAEIHALSWRQALADSGLERVDLVRLGPPEAS